MRQYNFLGLPNLAINILAGCVGFSIVLGGIKIYQAADVTFRNRDVQILLGGTASQLKDTAANLADKTDLIADREQQIQDLLEIYDLSLKNQQGYERLKQRIEALEKSPQIDGIEDIRQKISDTEQTLLEISEP